MALIRGRPFAATVALLTEVFRATPRFVAGRLSRRHRRLWVFGNVHGFRDSPRYLAEHLVHERPEIDVRWIARTQSEVDAATAAGVTAIVAGSAQADLAQRRAGVAFFTHGFRDLDMPRLSGAFLVFLWHGTPMKRIGLDAESFQISSRSVRGRVAAGFVTALHRAAFGLVDMFVAAGELEAQRFMSAFGVPRARLAVLGSPRFDVIQGGTAFERVAGPDLRARLGYTAEDHVVLWMPTHRREYGDGGWLPLLDRALLEQALGGTNIRILVKTHPNAEWSAFRERLPDDPRITLLAETQVDANALLHIADSLVTDYSSAVFDYSVLGRPIYFLAPDFKQYEQSRGLYDRYERITGGHHHATWTSLLPAIATDNARASEAEPGLGEGMDNWQRVADYCRNDSRPRTCDRIANAVIAATRDQAVVAPADVGVEPTDV